MAVFLRLRRRRSGALLGIVLALSGVIATFDAKTPASAQGLSWFGNLFGGMPRRQGPPAYPDGSGRRYGYGDDSNSYYNAPRRTPRKKRPAPVEQAQESAKPKAPLKTATVFVDVYGDSMGQLLASGLDDALADRTEVGVVHKAKGSTGLVTTSFYDWPRVIHDQLGIKEAKEKDAQGRDAKERDTSGEESKDKAAQDRATKSKDKKEAEPQEKIDVAVMMIGINDRQTIIEDGKKLEPGSDEWTAIYKKRILAINEAFAKKKIPLIWVGIPITKDDNFADDMAALNDIYREMAAKTGATYVDTWEAFSDDDGKFAAYGPDINGQTVKLRAADGIHFTKAGARKLAHFVEAHVRRDLDGKEPIPQLPTAEAPSSDGKKKSDGNAPSVVVVKPEAGPIKNLGEAPTAKDGHLAEVPKDTSVANFIAKEKGEAPKSTPPPGRVDNFRWPADGTLAGQ